MLLLEEQDILIPHVVTNRRLPPEDSIQKITDYTVEAYELDSSVIRRQVMLDTALPMATNYFHKLERSLFGSVRVFSFGLQIERGVACLVAHVFFFCLVYTSKGASFEYDKFKLRSQERKLFSSSYKFYFHSVHQVRFELDRSYSFVRLGNRRAAGRVAHTNSADESAACLTADNVQNEVGTVHRSHGR